MKNKLIYLDYLLSSDYINKLVDSLKFNKNTSVNQNNFWNQYNGIYSFEEINNIKNFCKEDFFDLLSNITNNMIIIKDDVPFINLKYINEWQTLIRNYGEDILVCNRLASEDKNNDYTREKFDWPTKCGIDDKRFNYIMSKGLCENHFHLKGSGPIAFYNYISLMVTDNIEYKFFNKKKSKQYTNNQTTNITFHQLYNVVQIERILRKFLFINILNIQFGKKIPLNDYLYEMLLMIVNLNVYTISAKIKDLNQYFDSYIKPIQLSYKYDDYCCYLGNDSELICGERALLYLYFRNLNKLNYKTKNIFHMYLILKSHIFKVFLQNDQNVGFSNFKKYDEIKDLFLTKSLENKYITKTSKDFIYDKNIRNIELRIAPNENFKKNLTKFISIEKCINDKENKHFFVYHFIKGRDYNISNPELPRNYKQRMEARKAADVIIGTISSIDDKNKIKGIDAANSEFGCRPEVYGQVFRYLRNINFKDIKTQKRIIKSLNMTYHVGEDFIDIIDGLRAIDEAINFLDLKNGDRLGHCLALGIDAEDYYRYKDANIIKTKQDALDDYVWMYQKISENGLPFLSFQNKIINNIELLLNELYEENENVTIIDYYHSMMLRGDNPYIYKNTINLEKGSFSRFDRNINMDSYYIYNKNKKAIELYVKYHFSSVIKKKGMETIEINITNEYVEIVREIQKILKKKIYDKGICIETNPTSNYLIGPFDNYSKLPVFNFNKYGLDNNFDINLPVTVCTDDQGIFSTCLENEYAMIFNCLTNQTGIFDKDNKYEKDKAYEYIDKLREYSLTYSFYTQIKD